jgi:hypothetical protein
MVNEYQNEFENQEMIELKKSNGSKWKMKLTLYSKLKHLRIRKDCLATHFVLLNLLIQNV